MGTVYRRELKLGLLLTTIGVLVLALTQFIFSTRTQFIAMHLKPLTQWAYQAGLTTDKLWQKGHALTQVYDENQALRDQIIQLTADQEQRKQLLAENQLLKNQLNAGIPENYQQILVSISGIDANVPIEQSLWVNKGKNANIVQNSPVIYNNVLIGTVTQVEENRALVKLITSPESKITAMILHEDGQNVEGILVGSFGVDLSLTQVLQGDDVKKGDTIVTSGKDGNYPQGLLLGTVKEILTNDADVFKEVSVEPIYQIDKLSTLFVIQGDQNNDQ